MAIPNYTIDENGNWVTETPFSDDLSLTLATANSYIDKNIIFKVNIDPIDLVQMAEIQKDIVNHLATIVPYADVRFGSSSAKQVYGDETFTITADDLTSGNLDIAKNGEYNVTNEKTVTVLTPKIRIASINITPTNNTRTVTIPGVLGTPLFYSFYDVANNQTANRVIAAIGINGRNILLAARGNYAAGANYSTNLLSTQYNEDEKSFTLTISQTASFGGNMTFTYCYLEEGTLQDTFV